MRILILTQWYPPEPANLIQELAQILNKKGHEVTVLTGFPNYPSGKIYPGYKLRLLQRETIEGVRTIRVILYPDHSLSRLRRSLNYISFGISSALIGILIVSKPDVIFVYHPPLTIGLPAYVLSRLWRIPFILQIQDMWPETLMATGMVSSRWILRLLDKFAKSIYAKAYRILVISPGFRLNLIEKKVPSEKIRVISNWVYSQQFECSQKDPGLADRLGISGSFNLMYAGNIGVAQGLETAIDAAALLVDIPEVKFVFVGDGISLGSLQKMVSSRKLENVRFIGRYSLKEMPKLYAIADGLLLHLKDDPLFRITIPSKTLTYLASGKPIIAAASGDVADIITSAGAGIVCPPEDPIALANSVRQLYEMSPDQREVMGEKGRKAAASLFSRDILTADIEAELQSALNSC